MERRGPQIGEADLKALEQRIGFSIPSDYRQFLLEVNGGRPDEQHCEWDRNVLNTLFSLNDDDESGDLLTRHERALPTLPAPSLLFVGHDDGGARILVAMDKEHNGEVWMMLTDDARPDDANPRVLWHDRRDLKKLANGFAEFMSSLRPLT